MITVLEYLVIAAVIGLVVFGIAVFVFGRGEQLAALSPRTSPSEMPEGAIGGDDVHRVRFGLALRGYRMSDVDWTLDRLADELDRLHRRIAELGGEPAPASVPPRADGDSIFGDAALGDAALGDAALGDAVMADRAVGGSGFDDRGFDDRGIDDGRAEGASARAAAPDRAGMAGNSPEPAPMPVEDRQWAPRHAVGTNGAEGPGADDPSGDGAQADGDGHGSTGPAAPRP